MGDWNGRLRRQSKCPDGVEKRGVVGRLKPPVYMVHATVEFTREVANPGKVCLSFTNSAPEVFDTILSIREAGTEELDLIVEADIGVSEG